MNPRKKNSTDETPAKLRLKVFGIGGAGNHAVAQLAGDIAGTPGHILTGIDLIAVNTDLPALHALTTVDRLQIGSAVTHGLGAGGDMELGLRAAQQDTERLEVLCQNTDIVFVVAGLGGGTGTGAAPVVARVAKDAGALVLGIAILPFTFEGDRRRQQALAGLDQLKSQADAVICLPNDKLSKLAGETATAQDAFRQGNDRIARGVAALWQLLSRPGLVNVDFAAVRAALAGKHTDGVFSFGTGTGAEKARDAVRAAVEHPLLEGTDALSKAEQVLVSVLGGPGLTLTEVQRAVEPITRAASRAKITMGAAIDESLGDSLMVTILATAQLTTRRGGALPVTRHVSAHVPASVAPVAPTTEPKKGKAQPKQESLPLEGVTRGRFEKSEPTLYNGQDLDVPTFMRVGISLKR